MIQALGKAFDTLRTVDWWTFVERTALRFVMSIGEISPFHQLHPECLKNFFASFRGRKTSTGSSLDSLGSFGPKTGKFCATMADAL
jgi:hypothetical protein